MRSRAVAIAMLALGAVAAVTVACAQDSEQSARQAEQRARETLAQHLKVGADTLVVRETKAHTWNDSSMGCGEPGSMALQVITEGYVVTLQAQQREYHVHVSGENAIVCERAARPRSDPRRGQRAQGISQAIELARQDLAQRLNVDPQSIRAVNVRPQRWPDSALGCARPSEQVVAGEVPGFRMMLVLDNRTYAYHASTTHARACPAIETD